MQHHIDTGESRPTNSRPYRIPQAQQHIVKQHIDKMLERDIIQPSVSNYSAPIVIVKKKSGEDRFCVDYRRLNAETRRDEYWLPQINEILDALGGTTVFSVLDLHSAYWQVPLHPDSMPKTAFTSMFGLYEFKVLSFGLTNAPPSFQRLMDFVLAGLQFDCCLIYLDDILVVSKDIEQHLVDLEKVFARFRTHKLRLKGKKCLFGCSSVPFLGFIVTKDGLKPDPEKVRAVMNMPTPTDQTGVRSFLGMASFYRRFIPNFAKIASPFTSLPKSPTHLFGPLKLRLRFLS
ncbi:MAG: RNA-directed DNA polymerase [Gammaproteobacteria bacterium]|nr:RNA-directed DNA polymerase [Gammaproteobacteria bacterium]